MKVLQQVVAAFLIALIASPAAWTQAQIAGMVVTSQSARVRDFPLPPGATIFSGDSISADATGGAQIALSGGGRIEVMRDSAVQLNHSAAGLQFVVLRGGISFAGSARESVETTLGDATIRSNDSASVGVLHVENPDSAVLAAVKGKLSIKTEHDAKSIDVPEGSVVRITLVDAPDAPEPQGGAQPAGRAAPAVKKLALIVFLFAAAFLAAFLWIAAHEPSETPSQLGSEISPFKVQ